MSQILVYECLKRANRDLTAKEIVILTGLGKSAVYSALKRLERWNEINKCFGLSNRISYEFINEVSQEEGMR